MTTDYKCPICREALASYSIVNSNELLQDDAGNLAVKAGDPRSSPSASVECGNGCAIKVAGRDRVAKLIAMMGVPDLEWLAERCLNVNLEINAHRDFHYQRASEAFADKERGEHLRQSCTAEVRAECERRNVILYLACYPDTSITSYSMTHWDLPTLLRDMRAEIFRDRPVKWADQDTESEEP